MKKPIKLTVEVVPGSDFQARVLGGILRAMEMAFHSMAKKHRSNVITTLLENPYPEHEGDESV